MDAFRTDHPAADQTVTLVHLTPDEWRTWREVRLRALATDPAAFGSTLAEWSGDHDLEQRWRDRLTTVPFNVVARVNGADVGQVSGLGPDEHGRYELISMWVAPEARRHGVGVALVHEVLTWAERQGATAIDLHVRPDNAPARTLYERCGFVADPTLDDDACDGMTRRL